MAAEQLTYAKAGGPPQDWLGLQIIDLDTMIGVPNVLEVNAVEGWVERYKMGPNDQPMVEVDDDGVFALVRERVEGRFEIRRPS